MVEEPVGMPKVTAHGKKAKASPLRVGVAMQQIENTNTVQSPYVSRTVLMDKIL